MRPLTLAQWLAELRRKGVQCKLHGGRVRVSGLRKLTAPERAALFASSAQVQGLLERRAQRRRKKEQQLVATTEPRREQRKVVGQHVVPGYSHLSRLLFDDEVKTIPTQRARVLGTVSYGWRVNDE